MPRTGGYESTVHCHGRILHKTRPLGAVIRNMFNFSRFAPSEFYLVAQLVEDARCFSLSFSDLDNATRLINQLMNCTKE